MEERRGDWRRAAAVFHERAAEYDSWYEESLLFAIELTALRELETSFSGPGVEIGVGPGRFAGALGVDFGIDPAFAPLVLARKRGIPVLQAVGEDLPLAAGSLGSCYLLFTFCFLADPARVVAECRRVLRPGGHLVVGMIPAGGPWGKMLAGKARDGHPFYRHARFLPAGRVASLLGQAGLTLVETRSSLFQEPDRAKVLEHSRPGMAEEAGFCLLVAER